MELVGRTVRKAFDGFGTFAGVVESYDPSAGYFKILYEDGDSEEVEFDEITAILGSMGESFQAGQQVRGSNRGRRPKKRRRTEPDRPPSQFASQGIREDDPPTGMLFGEGSVVEDPTLAKEIISPGVFLGIQANENGFDGNSEGKVASPLGFQETSQISGPGLVGNSEENASFEYESTSCGSEKEGQGRKKRQKLSELPASTPEMPVRRSSRARRAKSKFENSPDPVIFKDILTSDDSVLVEEKFKSFSVCPKPALPPSSNDLDIDGLPILDLFSVYTCLRSFSRLLFLSPFCLESFVAALRCRYANSLIDSIHFSIMQVLKPHLEFLSQDGSRSASECLRNLNWGLLDILTWPVYLVEYFLIRGPPMRQGFKLTHLRLLNAEYYTQPVAVKLEILRCLCDDIFEAEAIRSELNRRMVEAEPNADANCSMNVDKKLKYSITTGLGSSSLAQEVFEETVDGNIDECCLCRMDGNLICCDGCPAAFHSRCVGVAKDSLPEGDWYCPECLTDKGDGLRNLSKSFRGAEILGVDPHGRIYFGSCSYLLVSDSCGTDAAYHYYNKNDFDAVIKVLKSCYAFYSTILSAISMYWGVSNDASCSHGHPGHGIPQVHEDAQMFSKTLSSSKQDVATDAIIEWISKENCASENRGPESSDVLDLVELNPVASNELAGMTCPVAFSDISNEMTQDATCVPTSQQTCTDCSMESASCIENTSLKPTDLGAEQEKCIGFPEWGCMSLLTERRKIGTSQGQYDPASYLNYYDFGRIASSIAEELLKATSESNNKELMKSLEDIKSAQLKAISTKSSKYCSYAYQKLSIDALKEKCGWCFSCQTSSESDCLLKVADDKHLEGSQNRKVGLHSEKNKKSHLFSAIHHILSIEDRVRCLLSGPWEDPHYSKHWRKAVVKASDVASLKYLLLVLESNLRRVALTSEWLKPLDSVHTVGSASHFLTGLSYASSNHVSSRRQAKKSIFDSGISVDSHAAATSGIYWWRGGRLSRQVFHWMMLPQSLAYKGGRQAGRAKIPSIFYPDGSEFAKRSKFVAWRAAVEMSENVAQLIYQVKDFESNIRWTELSNTHIFPQMAKESKKLKKQLKKVTICSKCIEGTSVKYLLDFGKRETIPATVAKHGVMLEESSDGRKKYWLNETHVPLNLLKVFEEKRLARMMKKRDSELISEKGSKFKMNKPKRMKGLFNLLSREPQSQICGHCNKVVLIREAVNCQFCSAYFHKKHFRVPKAAVTTTYTCCRCKDKSLKVKARGHKVGSATRKISKRKKLQKIPLQKVPKKRKRVSVKSRKKSYKSKRGNRGKAKIKKSKKTDNIISWHKRRRTVVHHSYWLNGLLWSCKPAGERRNHFRENKVLLPSHHTEDYLVQPVCCLCHEKYNSEVIYIGCESCKDWFHGDVFFLTVENIDNLIGFKCHKCRLKSTPTCPFSKKPAITEIQLQGECNAGAENVGFKHQNHEEKHHGGTFEDCPAIFDSKDHMDEDQREDGLKRPKKELIIYCRTKSTNGRVAAQSLEHPEAKVLSSKHDNGIQLIVASQKTGKGLAINELLVTDKLGDSAESLPQAILSAQQLVDIENGKI